MRITTITSRSLPPGDGISRSSNGYLELPAVQIGLAVYDTSATGGANGSGGTGGLDANNDLSNFTISADVASSVAGGIGAGFLLRLNSSEANGYAVGVHATGTNSVKFDIGEGVSRQNTGDKHFLNDGYFVGGLIGGRYVLQLQSDRLRGKFCL